MAARDRHPFATLLRRHRAAAALTQEELAERAGLSQRGISELERGRIARPRAYTVRQLAAALGLAPPERDALLAAASAGEESVSPSPPLHNLPHELTPLLGREREEGMAVHILRWEGSRLLTLTGPGGVGKTRLARRIAAALLDDCPDGVMLVDLTPVRSGSLVIPTIVQTVGVREEGQVPVLTTLLAYLRDRRMLLLLDNFEQVLEAAPSLGTLLGACPDLRLLVTSREPLHLRGEQQMEVQPLPVPDLSCEGPVPLTEPIPRYPAISLFLQRGQAVNPQFRLTEQNAGDIASVCRRLDGLPLAIELAAAQVKFLPPHMLLAQLERRSEVLSGRGSDLPRRHRTMRDAIAWSYDLLSAEQKLFRRLAVFSGGCALEAVAEVCAGPGDLAIDPLEGLMSLVDKSLLTVDDRELVADSTEPRFRMLETIRAFGLDQLSATGERTELEQRHASYFLELAERGEQHLIGPDQGRWLQRLELEHDNLRAALTWVHASGEAHVGLRLAGALWRFWAVHGHWSEGRGWIESALAQSGREGAPEVAFSRAKALWAAGVLAREQSDNQRAIECFTEALTLHRKLGETIAAAGDLDLLGMVAKDQGEYGRAATLFAEGVELSRSGNNLHGVAMGLANLGEIARLEGEYDRAVALLEESRAVFQDIGHTWGVARSLTDLGRAVQAQGDYVRAAALYVESIELHRQVDYKPGAAAALEGLADLEYARGRPGRAAQLCAATSTLRAAIGAAASPHEQAAFDRTVAAVRAALGDEEFGACWSAGEAMTWEHVVVFALEGQFTSID